MRTTLFVVVSSFALAMSGATLANPASTSAAATAAPEPMAQSIAIPPAVQPVAAVDDEQKVICQHVVHNGTILPQQECRTKHLWGLIRLKEQKNFRDVQMMDDRP